MPTRSYQFSLIILAAVFALATPQCLAQQFARAAPFTDVRWDDETPIVRIDAEWYSLVSLDDILVKDLIAFSKQKYRSQWKMRFGEDLVDVLANMGHKLKANVRLVVVPAASTKQRTLEEVAMTEANRNSVRNLRLERLERSAATSPAVSIDESDRFRASIVEFLAAARLKADFSGAVVVAHGGKLVYQGAVGFSHLNSKAPNTIDTPFRIASLSKQFTAAAIFQLQADGKLKIDDPVHQYLAEFAKPPYSEITIHQLMTHTSGLPRTPEGVIASRQWNNMSKAATPVEDYVRLAVKMPLKSKPGASYLYSNFGYRVLSALIARVSGMSYADYMEQKIFQPLGMKNTGVARVNRPASESRIAEGLALTKLESDGSAYRNGERDRNYGAGYGSGGIFASAKDLVKWDGVLTGNDFLSETQKKRLFEPIHGNYACGWKVEMFPLDECLVHSHSGSNQGFFSKMMRLPEQELVIITVGNVNKSDEIDEVIEQLFRLCRSIPYRNP